MEGAPTAPDAPVLPEADSAKQPGSGLILVVPWAVCAGVIFLVRRWHRLSDAPARPLAMSDAATPAAASEWMTAAERNAATWMLVLILGFLAFGILGASIARLSFDIPSPREAAPGAIGIDEMAQLALGIYLAQTLALAGYIVLRMHTPPPASDRRLARIEALASGAGGLLLTWPFVLLAAEAVRWLLHAPVEPLAHETLREMAAGEIGGWFIVLAAMVLVAAPIMEEVTYRGLLQTMLVRGLGRRGRWLAIVLTSIVFTLMHTTSVELHALAALFMLSLGLGWLYEKTGRLSAAIVMHALFNAANLGLAMLTTTAEVPA